MIEEPIKQMDFRLTVYFERITSGYWDENAKVICSSAFSVEWNTKVWPNPVPTPGEWNATPGNYSKFADNPECSISISGTNDTESIEISYPTTASQEFLIVKIRGYGGTLPTGLKRLKLQQTTGAENYFNVIFPNTLQSFVCTGGYPLRFNSVLPSTITELVLPPNTEEINAFNLTFSAADLFSRFTTNSLKTIVLPSTWTSFDMNNYLNAFSPEHVYVSSFGCQSFSDTAIAYKSARYDMNAMTYMPGNLNAEKLTLYMPMLEEIYLENRAILNELEVMYLNPRKVRLKTSTLQALKKVTFTNIYDYSKENQIILKS